MNWFLLFLVIFFGILGAIKMMDLFRGLIIKLIESVVFKKGEDIKIWSKP